LLVLAACGFGWLLADLAAVQVVQQYAMVAMIPVMALARRPGIVVTGTVPDVRPYLAHAAVSVAPLRVARGVQNKVLEAMAMALPVVVSPQALEGIDAAPGADLLLADGAEPFAAAVLRVLGEDDQALRAHARDRVERLYSWPNNLANIEARLECN
jgi:glycosyltransferase involved in cell wall biosynthesis